MDSSILRAAVGAINVSHLTSRTPPRIAFVVRAGRVSSDREDTAGFIKRMEQTWLISKQPKPVPCSSCRASGKRECLWCKGTGFFILGDNMLCEVESHNTSCYICSGEGLLACDKCKGTGYRAGWLGQEGNSKKS